MPGMANLFLDTMQVTVLRGGERINVVPERASALLDIRLLPDTDSAAFLADVKQRLGKGFDGQGAGDLAPLAAVAGLGPALRGDGQGPRPRRSGGPHLHRRLHRLALLPRAGDPRLRRHRRSSSPPTTRRGFTAPTNGFRSPRSTAGSSGCGGSWRSTRRRRRRR